MERLINIIGGVGTIFGMLPCPYLTFIKPSDRSIFIPNDSNAMRSDFIAVGKDLQNAMEQFREEYEPARKAQGSFDFAPCR